MSKVVLYNKGKREFHLKSGDVFMPETTMELDEKEANFLTSKYHREVIVAVEKISDASLIDENASLKARIAELEDADNEKQDVSKKRGRKAKEEAVEVAAEETTEAVAEEAATE